MLWAVEQKLRSAGSHISSISSYPSISIITKSWRPEAGAPATLQSADGWSILIKLRWGWIYPTGSWQKSESSLNLTINENNGWMVQYVQLQKTFRGARVLAVSECLWLLLLLQWISIGSETFAANGHLQHSQFDSVCVFGSFLVAQHDCDLICISPFLKLVHSKSKSPEYW